MRGRRGSGVCGLFTLATACLTICVLATSAATAAGAPEYLSSFGPDGTAGSEFERARSVAIDQESGAVYVIDGGAEGALYKFHADGSPFPFSGSAPYISNNRIELPIASCFACVQAAVDPNSHDIYVTSANSVRAFHADGEPSEFTAGPGTGTDSINGFGELAGIAVDINGTIYASDASGGVVRIYAHSGETLTQFSATQAGNLAVSTNGTVYVNSSGVHAFAPSEMPVTVATGYTAAPQPFDAHASRTVATGPVSNDVYIGEISPNPAIARYDDEDNRLATFAGPEEEGEVSEPLGIAIVGANNRVFVADGPFENSGLPSQVKIFGFIPGPPKVTATSVAGVSADSATLKAKINPNSFATTYHFEYGLDDCAVAPCTSIPLAGAGVGDGHEAVSVAQSVGGLEPVTAYHFRVVAENSEGRTDGPDRVFSTQLSGFGFDLADGRAWEMVSPPDKHGALLKGSDRALVQAATGGDGLVYASIGSIEANPEANRPFEPVTVLAHRTVEGWHSKDLTPPTEVMAPLNLGNQSQYKVFSPELASAVLEPASLTALSQGGVARSPYLRENTEPATVVSLLSEENLLPGSEPAGHVTAGAVAPSLDHIGLISEVPLVEGAPSAGNYSLYLWTAGQVQPISVLPAAEGGAMVVAQQFGSRGTVRHAISNNGSRVFWSADGGGALYLRDTEADESIRLDIVQTGGNGLGAPHPVFQGASADGEVVFFTDSQQLSEGASPEGNDLYRCVIPAGSPAAGCASLTDLSSPLEGSGESAKVEKLVTGVSEDGSTIYFVARGRLDNEPNEVGDIATSGRPNLYVWHEGSGVRFIAGLSEKDNTDWGGPEAGVYLLSAATSPGGRYLVFASRLSLTRHDNLDAVTSEPVQQVFRYDLVSNALECISCDPTGAAPEGGVVEANSLVDPRGQWAGKLVAATVPEPSINAVAVNTVFYTPRSALDNGRVYFNSIDSLVPSDSNGQWDVYQYEPIGIGECSTAVVGPAVIRSGGGCVSLISSGTGEEEVGFIDASASGNDVFFLTPARLNEPDHDHEFDVYDARVNGVPAMLPSSTECLGEACQSLPAAPDDSTVASATFQGPGNIKQQGKHCRKGQRRVRRKGKTVCVRVRQKRHHRGEKSSANSKGKRR